MKTFCIFTANYLPYLGGIERNTSKISKYLITAGYNVIIVTSNVFRLNDFEIKDNVKIYRMPCLNLLKGRFPVLKKNKLFFKLNRQLLDEPVDYVIVNTRFYRHSLYGVKFAQKVNAPCIVHERGTGHFTINNIFFDVLGHLYEHLITACLKQYPLRFFGVSEACNEWLEHFGIQSTGVIYNAIDISEVNNYTKKPEIDYRSKLQLSSDDIIITFTGRLVKEKGLLKLIEAVKIINKTKRNVYLFIAGDGPLQDDLKVMADSNIFVLGRIDSSKIFALLSQTDIFCLPTDYPEGFPTSVMEAVACHCFCITTTRGGSKELIIDDSYGIILEQNTPETIVSAIEKAISDPVYRQNTTNNAYERLVNNFSWENTVEKFVQSFKIEQERMSHEYGL